ncbi:MAG: DUF1905 domain-containing protein [Bacteroidia bacterium]|nr:YdeI/OmpD-associated family protein [Bacteroidia bacterium]NNM15739.1 DUF1905 domain-containing protein [Bacteroidia bacterium]
MKFKSTLQKFNSNLWGYYIEVPDKAVKKFSDGNQRRVICTLNNALKFQCAIMPSKKGSAFINVNKKNRDALNLKIGSEVNVLLEQDKSKYGLPMPEELQEVLNQDKEGDDIFHALTPGKQRSVIYMVNNVKNVDKRIRKAIIIIDHLKSMNGKIDYKILIEELKSS